MAHSRFGRTIVAWVRGIRLESLLPRVSASLNVASSKPFGDASVPRKVRFSLNIHASSTLPSSGGAVAADPCGDRTEEDPTGRDGYALQQGPDRPAKTLRVVHGRKIT